MTDQQIYLSVVIASYNSADALQKNLSALTNYLSQCSFSSEIIIVDDGSDDHGLTENVVKSNNCIYIKQEVNKGKGAAVKKGMLSAKGEFRIFTDADIPYEPEVIPRFLHYLDFKEFDLAVGDRSIGETDYYNKVGITRSLASKVFSFIVGRFIAGGIFDTQCGIKGFKAEVAEKIFNSTQINGFAFDIEIFHIALIYNYDIKRLPVKLRSQDGKSINVLRNSIAMLFDLIKIMLNKY